MTRDEVVTLFAARQEAVKRHDVAALTMLAAEDCVVESPLAGGIVKGHAAIAAIHRAWHTAFPDAVMTTEQLLVEGDRAVWIVTATGTDTGGFMGFRF